MTNIRFKTILSVLSYHGFFRWIPTRLFLRLKYRLYTGKRLNLKNPISFNEKLQWLKIYNSKHVNPDYTNLADKLKAKEVVKQSIGEKYIIRTIGTWNRFEEIDFKKLPASFVLKTNHDSGGVVVVPDKEKMNIKAAKKRIEKSRRINFYWYGREPQYKNIKPKVFAEEYITDESGYELKDYKFFCFDGSPKLIQVDFGRFSNHRRNIYDTSWNFINTSIKFPNDPNHQIEKPCNLNEMLDLSRKLSKGIPFVRVDLYSVKDRVFFGELTFFHGSGFERFTPEEFDINLGKMLQLPDNR